MTSLQIQDHGSERVLRECWCPGGRAGAEPDTDKRGLPGLPESLGYAQEAAANGRNCQHRDHCIKTQGDGRGEASP